MERAKDRRDGSRIPIITRRVVTVFILLVCTMAALPAEEHRIVATTPWTAAFVRTAGFEGELNVLAPYELRHPPEYELRPSDIVAVSEADLIVFAGYEVMTQKLKAAGGKDDVKMIQITTAYAPPVIRQSVLAIADELGTRIKAEKNLKEIETFFDDWRAELQAAGWRGAKVLVHFHQQALTKALGFDILGVFGPGPLEAKQIMELSRLQPRCIIDNWHNDVGKPLRETMADTPVSSWINFPGHEGTRSLLDVLRYNRRRLSDLLTQS